MKFVGIDGGEVEEPSVESLEVIPLDSNRVIKYRFYEVIDGFANETEV